MRKVYHLSTCSTCQRIIKELELDSKDFELQDLKVNNISSEELEGIKEQVGSFEALFSKRAMKFRALGLDKLVLTEKDLRKHILEEYTFLKRPVIVLGDQVFVGNAAKTVAEVAKHL